MKITYLLTSASARAGTEKAFSDQSRAMAAREHDVTVASVYRGLDPGFDLGPAVRRDDLTHLPGAHGAPSRIIPDRWDDQFCAAADRALLDYLGAVDSDVVVTSTPALTVYALLALPPAVHIVQQEHRATMTRGVTAEPVLLHSPLVDSLVSLTRRNAEWLAEQWSHDAPRIDVIPNSLPVTGRPRSGGGQKVIMSAGRLVPSKGFEDLIRAFARTAPSFPDWRLRIFGDGPLRQGLHTLARNMGVASRVEIMPPSLDLEAEWARAEIGALASRSEGLPLVLLEARAAGLPLVAYDCFTGPAEIIEGESDGILVPLRDVSALGDALGTMMGDASRRRMIAERTDESIARFDPQLIADRWEELLVEVTADPLTARQRFDVRAEAGVENAEDSESTVEETQEHSDHHDAVIPAERGTMIPDFARERTRQRLEELFAGTPVRSRALRSGTTTAWGVPIEQRESVLELLAGADLPATEIRLYRGATRLDRDGEDWRPGGLTPEQMTATRFFIFTHYEHEATGQRIGYAAGSTVEFWEHDASRPELYAAPSVNDEVSVLLPDQFDQPLFTPWTPMRGLPLWSELPFPIDAVYTWVDGSDPQWQRRKAEATGTSSIGMPEGAVQADRKLEELTELATGEVRFRNREELRYSLRALHVNAPWIRRIYVVTDAQRPPWLADDDRITIVDHRDLFPDSSVLPVFNSHAIETVLHRIDGLSEHFLYFNDDVLLMRPQSPEQFFTSTGQAMFYPSSTKINELGAAAEPHEAAGMNNRELLESDYRVSITRGMLHTPHPHRVSQLHALEERYSEQIQRTRASRFRSSQDVALLSSLAQYSGYLDGTYRQGSLRVAFVSLGTADTAARLTRAASQALDVLTFGEALDDPDPDITQEMATNFMASAFPIPGPWERDAGSDRG